MSRHKTGRTEGIYIHVTPEIREEIREQVRNGVNITKAFEEMWTDRFPSKESIEISRKECILKMDKLNRKLDEINSKAQFEATLILTPKDRSTLKICTDDLRLSEEKQMELFCGGTGRKLQGLPHYLAIRNQYYRTIDA